VRKKRKKVSLGRSQEKLGRRQMNMYKIIILRHF